MSLEPPSIQNDNSMPSSDGASVASGSSSRNPQAAMVPSSPPRATPSVSPAAAASTTPLSATPQKRNNPFEDFAAVNNPFVVPNLEVSSFPAPPTPTQTTLVAPQRPSGVNANSTSTNNPSSDASTTYDEQSHGDTVGSTVTGPGGVEGYTRTDHNAGTSSSTFGKLRRSMNRNERTRSTSIDDTMPKGVLIFGYLQKLGRNGKWSTRWFESDGECLTYYKTSQRAKLMATLDLTKVGSIKINSEDPTGYSFVINISDRPYRLRADSKVACRDWVITLNRAREARLHEGNVKLVVPSKKASQRHVQPPDLLADSFTPRVVVVANRERTRAVDDLNQWETEALDDDPAAGNESFYNDGRSPTHVGHARWVKPKTGLTRFARKMLKWARSLRKLGCMLEADQQVVMLDHHLHPPGHDDKPSQTFGKTGSSASSTASPAMDANPISKTSSGSGAPRGHHHDVGHGAWIGKEVSGGDRVGSGLATKDLQGPPPAVQKPSKSEGSGSAGAEAMSLDDDEPRELS